MLIGVIGKANVGKSTFFKALTLADVEIANYPFATIKPNLGVGFIEVECPETRPQFGQSQRRIIRCDRQRSVAPRIAKSARDRAR